MGLLSMHIKPIFLGFMRNSHSLSWFIVFFSLINLSVCIYEDQIGKFDWRQSYVGRIKFSQFDTVSTAKKIIVATEENVLAALNLKTGQVVWRHVFESASQGNIQLLHVTEKVVTVSGSNPYLVRGWDSSTGVLLWEWSLTLQNDETADLSEWWVQQGMLVHVLPVFGSHLEVTMYNIVTGQNRGASSKLPAQWSNDGCIVSPPYYTCISGDTEKQLFSLDVTSSAVKIISKPLSDYITAYTEVNLRPLDGNSVIPGFILDDMKIVLIKEQFEVLGVGVKNPTASVAITDSANGPILIQTWSDKTEGFILTAHSISNGQELSDIETKDRQLAIPDPEISAAICTKSREQNVCRFLVTSADDASHLMQQGGRVIWTREESLANVVTAEFVELPVSELDAAIESEFDQKEGSIWGAFTRRLQTQYQQVVSLVQALQKGQVDDDEPTHLVRDYFNLHKIIVLVTDVGKVFGMDNLSGDILWRFYEPNLDTENIQVFTRRSARHPPYDAYLSIVGKHEETGNAMIISINPITGAAVGDRTVHLDVPPLQCALLHKTDKQKLHALILLDIDEKVHIFPETAAELVENMFMYVVDKNTAVVQGYALKYDGEVVRSSPTWRVALAGGAAGARVRGVAARARAERVHSAGRVLPDRSVLYKYNNHNLVLFVVDAPDPVHKDMVIATCVDVVSGSVECSAVHRRARATDIAVHTDNMLAYVYYNDKLRRTEIATMELYEGKQRWSAEEAQRSLGASRRPDAVRAAYVLPNAAAAAATRTRRALTDIHLILCLSMGGVVEVPWGWVEPARALAGEGGAPPEVAVPHDAVLNYNRSLPRSRAVFAAPAGLESTSLVLVTGLDLFYTRVAPSKTFDLLKDDFDYYLITIVLAALIVASYSTKYFASRKMLKMAWK